MENISSFYLFILEIKLISESTFLTMFSQTLFDQLLNYVNLYQHAKNQAILLICSGYMGDNKILQSDWLRTFWPISLKRKYY